MRAVATALIICGTALFLMPQIWHAVAAANTAYAVGLAANGGMSLSPDDALGAPMPAWLAMASVGFGMAMVVVGVFAVLRPGRRPSAGG